VEHRNKLNGYIFSSFVLQLNMDCEVNDVRDQGCKLLLQNFQFCEIFIFLVVMCSLKL